MNGQTLKNQKDVVQVIKIIILKYVQDPIVMKSKNKNFGNQVLLQMQKLVISNLVYFSLNIALEKERIAKLKTAADFNKEEEEKKKKEEEAKK